MNFLYIDLCSPMISLFHTTATFKEGEDGKKRITKIPLKTVAGDPSTFSAQGMTPGCSFSVSLKWRSCSIYQETGCIVVYSIPTGYSRSPSWISWKYVDLEHRKEGCFMRLFKIRLQICFMEDMLTTKSFNKLNLA